MSREPQVQVSSTPGGEVAWHRLIRDGLSPEPFVLIVDDDEGLVLLLAETLRTAGCHVATANSGASALT
jgi:hypothetical protein